jgi:hypothetical protein
MAPESVPCGDTVTARLSCPSPVGASDLIAWEPLENVELWCLDGYAPMRVLVTRLSSWFMGHVFREARFVMDSVSLQAGQRWSTLKGLVERGARPSATTLSAQVRAALTKLG